MNHAIPTRAEVPESDRWNLSSLYESTASWEKGLESLQSMQKEIPSLRAVMAAETDIFLKVLAAYSDYLALDERLGYYAHLTLTEDEGDSEARGRFARYMDSSTQGQGAWAWLTPAIQTLPESFLNGCIKAERFADFSVYLKKVIRMKPHILSDKEERLLALQAETNQLAQESFGILTNVDFDFGKIRTPEGLKPLSQSTFAAFMRDKDRALRRNAYKKFYGVYHAHRNTLASLYAGSVKLDKYQAQVSSYGSSREQALFPDDVPVSVYDNLVKTVGDNLSVLHEYYELRRKALKLDELRHYDVYVPIVSQKEGRYTYDQAVEIVAEALEPLGGEYVDTLKAGLLGGWVDRYENKGKRSGAFSAGSYHGDPYILLNYKDTVLRDLFTMAHEGGHSMHSWYSSRHNPFMSYSYTIFEAEVASTFNEHLVFKYLYDRTTSREEKTSLISNRIDDTLATLFRQTMFAEFEATSHAMAEAGEPLTLDALRSAYGALLRKYFGPGVVFEKESDLEGLRIPHFYNAFYVYKYATGISASRALAVKVTEGGPSDAEAYFRFLKSGGSRFPIDSLALAGVDMATPAPVRIACESFGRDVAMLKDLLSL